MLAVMWLCLLVADLAPSPGKGCGWGWGEGVGMAHPLLVVVDSDGCMSLPVAWETKGIWRAWPG